MVKILINGEKIWTTTPNHRSKAFNQSLMQQTLYPKTVGSNGFTSTTLLLNQLFILLISQTPPPYKC